MTEPLDFWNSVYDNGSAPWVIDRPQPEIVALEQRGEIHGSVLDIGCGAGEHTIHLSKLGYRVRGLDHSPSAIAYARANAARQGVDAQFEVGDALKLENRPGFRFDAILDSALFHVFAHDGGDPADYVRNLHAICVPDGVVHVLALSDTEPGFGPRIGEAAIRNGFADGWTIEELRPARYHGRITEAFAEADLTNQPVGTEVDAAAWLARIRCH
jgi:SAM-dependent methyltransferase